MNDTYLAGSMHVEEGTTPDGRRLLYFTFPEPGQDQTLEAGGESTHGQTAPGPAAGA